MGGTWAIFQKRGLAIGCNTASKPSIWFHGKNLTISIHVIFQFCQFWLRAFFSFSPAKPKPNNHTSNPIERSLVLVRQDGLAPGIIILLLVIG